jgi:hypothetical protein
MNRPSLAVFSLFSFLLLFTSVSVAQLGEVAGQPHFMVSLGGTNTITITVVSQAPYPLPVKVILPTLTSKDANAITPTITASVMEGSIPPGGDLHINVTVYMPGGTNKLGYNWTGVMQVIAVPNSTSGSGGGAQIMEGVAKIVTITATAHMESIWDWLTPVLVVVIIIVAVAVVIFAARRKGMLGGKPSAKKAQPEKRAAAARTRGKKAKAKPRRRASRRRRTAGRSRSRAKKGRKTTRRRRRT